MGGSPRPLPDFRRSGLLLLVSPGKRKLDARRIGVGLGDDRSFPTRLNFNGIIFKPRRYRYGFPNADHIVFVHITPAVLKNDHTLSRWRDKVGRSGLFRVIL